MKSSYVLILVILGIIVIHALDDRKDRKTEKTGKKAQLVKKSIEKPVASPASPTIVSTF